MTMNQLTTGQLNHVLDYQKNVQMEHGIKIIHAAKLNQDLQWIWTR